MSYDKIKGNSVVNEHKRELKIYDDDLFDVANTVECQSDVEIPIIINPHVSRIKIIGGDHCSITRPLYYTDSDHHQQPAKRSRTATSSNDAPVQPFNPNIVLQMQQQQQQPQQQQKQLQQAPAAYVPQPSRSQLQETMKKQEMYQKFLVQNVKFSDKNKYRFSISIGTGTYGEVFKGYVTQTNKAVAIKRMFIVINKSKTVSRAYRPSLPKKKMAD